jgi:hypothetical protein
MSYNHRLVMLLVALLFSATLIAGCPDGGGDNGDGSGTAVVLSTDPEQGETDVPLEASIIIRFAGPAVPDSIDGFI